MGDYYIPPKVNEDQLKRFHERQAAREDRQARGMEQYCPSCSCDWHLMPPTQKPGSDYFDCMICKSTFLRPRIEQLVKAGEIVVRNWPFKVLHNHLGWAGVGPVKRRSESEGG